MPDSVPGTAPGTDPRRDSHSGPDSAGTGGSGARAAAAFRSAVERHDTTAAVALLADDVVFASPIVHRTYRGRDAVAPVLLAVAEVFEDFRYTAEYGSSDGFVLRFATRVGDRDLEGVDLLTTDGSGRIAELTVMVRPYSAATALRERMAALLTAER